MSAEPRILIAASGSGGHLMPALYIAQAIKKISPQAQIKFVGSGRPLEADLIDRAGFAREAVALVGLKNRGLAGLLQFLSLVPKAIARVNAIISDFRPNVVIGVGGYVSVLPVTLAFIRGIPRWIHEAELKPGMANALLSLYATKVSTAFKTCALWRKGNVIFTGHPLRADLHELPCRISAQERPSRILVLGGSQGAHAVDEAFMSFASWIKEQGIEVWHQCRAQNVEQVQAAYTAAHVTARVAPFIHELSEAYAWSDIVVSRSGAGATMELGVVNRPCILVPYPHAQGNHQLHNAQLLTAEGKALLVEQGPEFPSQLKKGLEELLDPVKYHEMHARAYSGRLTNAAETIARGCLDLA